MSIQKFCWIEKVYTDKFQATNTFSLMLIRRNPLQMWQATDFILQQISLTVKRWHVTQIMIVSISLTYRNTNVFYVHAKIRCIDKVYPYWLQATNTFYLILIRRNPLQMWQATNFILPKFLTVKRLHETQVMIWS